MKLADHKRDLEGDNALWEQIWETVPAPWRTGMYRLDQSPHNEVFVRNTMYLRSKTTYDFRPTTSLRMGQEVAWWIYTVWAEGTRKVDPAMLRWWQRAVDSLAKQKRPFSNTPASVSDFDPVLVIREALRQFQGRHNRMPSSGNVRNLTNVAYGIHELLGARCTSSPWWTADVWDLRIDNRIPRRLHEPAGDRPVNLRLIEPPWLREGVRFWLSRGLTNQTYTWSSVVSRSQRMAAHFGRYLCAQQVAEPCITSGDDPDPHLRLFFVDFLSWLRSPARSASRAPLSNQSVRHVQSDVQTFYEFLYEHAHEAAQFTSNDGWRELTARHTRLWAPEDRIRKRNDARRPVSYITTADLSRMLSCIEVLSATPIRRVTVIPNGDINPITSRGLGDPAAARIWLLQALTGRRASEILMLDYHPITPVNLAEASDGTAFVARLRYQQTKIEGVDPTIPVEQAVVNVIEEQQAWLQTQFPDVQSPAHLFLQHRGNYKGIRPRSYRSYADALRRLDKALALEDSEGHPLRFTQTHRLRHTRATELLNGGVPIHVVQRYLGHRSPEMTMRYATTLAETAEAEFLRYKKVGSDGRLIDIAPRDLLDLTQLDKRADRLLPNGVCLLPPTQKCDKGNACLPCGSFATDASHLPEHVRQRDRTIALIEMRQEQFETRFGAPMPESNIWLSGRRRELASLTSIINRLEEEDVTQAAGVAGPGTSSRGAIPVEIVTDGAHAAALSKVLADRIDP